MVSKRLHWYHNLLCLLLHFSLTQATNIVWIPWNMAFIAGYEGLKRQAATAMGAESPDSLPPWVPGLCSAGGARRGAGVPAAWATTTGAPR